MYVSEALLLGMFQFVDRHLLEISMAQAGGSLEKFFQRVKQNSLAETLDEYGVLGRRPDLPELAIPDAVWAALLAKTPSLQVFPIGQWTEYAVKTTALNIFANNNKVNDLSFDDVLLQYASNFLFQLCMNQFRRSDAEAGIVNGVRYNFMGRNKVAPIHAEESFRQFLFNQCNDRVRDTLTDWKKHLRKISSQIKDNEPFSGKPLVNVFVGARLPSDGTENYDMVKDPLRLMLHTPSSNISFNIYKDSSSIFKGLENCLGACPTSLVRDLLDIGAITYMADIHTERAHHLERKLGILMPVRHPDIWQNVKDKLEQTVSFLGGDSVSFTFTKKADRLQPIDAFSVSSDEKRCVSLFSGGLDSTAGAIWLLNNGFKPIFISQYANAKLAGYQKKLLERIEKKFLFSLSPKLIDELNPGELSQVLSDQFKDHGHALGQSAFVAEKTKEDQWSVVTGEKEYYIQRTKKSLDVYSRRFQQEIQHIGFFVGRSRKRKRVYHRLPGPSPTPIPQFLRSFLFLSLATSIAIEEGIDKIFIFENGPVALNPQFSEARVNTQTAHPSFLARYAELIKAAFNVEIKIEDPFLYSTKGEVVRHFNDIDDEDLLSYTTSCWAWSRVPLMAKQQGETGFKGKHCGSCLPCILRRVAVQSAGLFESKDEYVRDGFKSYLDMPTKDIVALDDFIRYCQFIRGKQNSSNKQSIELSPDFSIYESDIDCNDLLDMYRRHADEVLNVCFGNSQQIADRFSE
jgi:7-cyano-7-deazaguanine synthase in queuosine biosynthesis